MSIRTFALNGPIDLHVRLGHGVVTVTASAERSVATVRLEADDDAARALLDATEVGLRGSTLHVFAPRQVGVFELGGKRAAARLDVHVEIPSGAPVRINTADAPITVFGRVGTADLTFGSGEATVDAVDGNLRLRCWTGAVRFAQVTGSVHVRSGSGDVTFGEIGGDLVATCGSGDLQAAVVRGLVHSRCGSGSARLGAVHGDVDLVGGSGQLEIGLPIGLSARLDVRTGSGRVRSELPIEDAASPNRETITVRARAGSGDVRLFRAA